MLLFQDGGRHLLCVCVPKSGCVDVHVDVHGAGAGLEGSTRGRKVGVFEPCAVGRDDWKLPCEYKVLYTNLCVG